MKQITLKNVNDDSLVNSRLYYGVKFTSEKGFILSNKYCSGEFLVASPQGITHLNNFGGHNRHRNLRDLILKLIKPECPEHSAKKVFVFDNYKALFRWLLRS